MKRAKGARRESESNNEPPPMEVEREEEEEEEGEPDLIYVPEAYATVIGKQRYLACYRWTTFYVQGEPRMIQGDGRINCDTTHSSSEG